MKQVYIASYKSESHKIYLARLDLTIQPRISSDKQLEYVTITVKLGSNVLSVKFDASIGNYTFDQVTKVPCLFLKDFIYSS